MADLSENMNMEALVGVIMGILFTILISLILLLMKRNKKSEKVFGTYRGCTIRLTSIADFFSFKSLYFKRQWMWIMIIQVLHIIQNYSRLNLSRVCLNSV